MYLNCTSLAPPAGGGVGGWGWGMGGAPQSGGWVWGGTPVPRAASATADLLSMLYTLGPE